MLIDLSLLEIRLERWWPDLSFARIHHGRMEYRFEPAEAPDVDGGRLLEQIDDIIRYLFRKHGLI